MRPGDVIAARFEIERLASAGGMGSVYRARDRKGGGLVALKILYGEEAARIERFEREALVLADVVHPGIVRYVAHGTLSGGGRYLAMEWLEGDSLEDRLRHSRLGLAAAVEVVRRAAEALAAAHARGIVHRDVKPSNLFLEEGRIDRLRVLDFGIARPGGAGSLASSPGILLGTPGYMAPEQARGGAEIDPRADVFALGCVLYECVAGRAPFVGEDLLALLARILVEDPLPLGELRPDVPEALDDLCRRMLAKDPARRPEGAAHVAAELAALGELLSSEPTHMVEVSDRPARAQAVILAAGHEDAETRPEIAPLGAVAESFGGRVEELAGGSVVVILQGGPPARLAARVARCALALRPQLPSLVLAVAIGQGEGIDRAASILRGRGAARPEAIHLDEEVAGLLDLRFEVGGDADGLILVGERDLGDEPRAGVEGREAELERIERLVQGALAGSPVRAFHLAGPAGAGKSRLLRELAARFDEEGAVTLWRAEGRPPAGAASAFGLIGRLLRHAAGILLSDPIPLRRLKLEARLDRHLRGAELERAVEALGEIAGAPRHDERSPTLRAARRDPRVLGERVRAAFLDLACAEAAAQPLVLLVDDLQWADRSSLALLQGAREGAVGEPFVLGSAGRGEAATPWLAERIALEPASASREDDPPPVLLAASVFGTHFWTGAVEALVGPAAEVLTGLAARGALIRLGERTFARETEWAFPSAAAWERARAGAGEAERIEQHRVAGMWLEKSGEVDAAVLAEHFERGREPARARTYLLSAADHLLAGGDLEGARAAADRARAQAGGDGAPADARGRTAGKDTLGLARLREAQARLFEGRPREALGPALEALATLTPGPLRQTALGVAAAAAGTAGDVASLRELAASAPAGRGDAAGAIAQARLAIELLRVGQAEAAAVVGARLRELEEDFAPGGRSGDPQALAWLLRARAARVGAAGDLALALKLFDSAVTTFELIGDTPNAAAARLDAGRAYLMLGGDAVAERLLREAIAEARRVGLADVVAEALAVLGRALRRRGALHEAEAAEAKAAAGGVSRDAGEVAADQVERLLRGKQASSALPVIEAFIPAASAAPLDRGAAFVLEASPLAELRLMLLRAECLKALGREAEATAALAAARARLYARAALVSDPAWRESFLRFVPENARIVELAAKWLA